MFIRRRLRYVITLGLLLTLGMVSIASAQPQSSSPDFSVNEVFFGSGGELNSCSGSYCSKQSAGDLGVGNTSSNSFQAQAGFNTDRSPSLTLLVGTTNINMGVLVPGTPAQATATFSVKSYLASGYIVKTVGNPPTYDTHQMATSASAVASDSSQEQFGINLVKNQTTCPTPAPFNYGADPAQIPDSSFSFGVAASGYNTCGLFKYQNGDTIALSNSSSGETDYTISYLFNITHVTPAGTYNMAQSIVATSTF